MNYLHCGNLWRMAGSACMVASVVVGSSVSAFAQGENDKGYSQAGLRDHETTQAQDKKLYELGELKPGDRAPDIELTPLTDSGPGAARQLSSLYKEKPLVVLMGSCTCGMTKDNLPQLNKTHSKLGDKANFAFIYMKDAHPSPKESVKVDGHEVQLVQSQNMKHRIDLAKYLIRDTGLTFPLYIDDMKGTARKAYEGFHNSAFIIDTSGRLVFAERYMYKASDVEAALASLLEKE